MHNILLLGKGRGRLLQYSYTLTLGLSKEWTKIHFFYIAFGQSNPSLFWAFGNSKLCLALNIFAKSNRPDSYVTVSLHSTVILPVYPHLVFSDKNMQLEYKLFSTGI